MRKVKNIATQDTFMFIIMIKKPANPLNESTSDNTVFNLH